MSAFETVLKAVAARIPDARAVMIIGSDGIAVERVALRGDAQLDALAAELATLLKGSLGGGGETGLGALEDVTVISDRLKAVMMALGGGYFLLAALDPDGLVGRARYAMRLGALRLADEFA